MVLMCFYLLAKDRSVTLEYLKFGLEYNFQFFIRKPVLAKFVDVFILNKIEIKSKLFALLKIALPSHMTFSCRLFLVTLLFKITRRCRNGNLPMRQA